MFQFRSSGNDPETAEELGLKAMERQAVIWGKNGKPCTLNVFWKSVMNYTDGLGGPGHKKARLSCEEN